VVRDSVASGTRRKGQFLEDASSAWADYSSNKIERMTGGTRNSRRHADPPPRRSSVTKNMSPRVSCASGHPFNLVGRIIRGNCRDGRRRVDHSAYTQTQDPPKEPKRKMRPPKIDLSVLFPKPRNPARSSFQSCWKNNPGQL
jgi:hypothetical protein